MNPNETNTMSGMSSGMPPKGPANTPEGKEKGIGALIGIVVIIAIIIIGGLYFWGERLVNDGQSNDQSMEQQAGFQPIESASDEVTDIEADLSATELNNLDAELNAINQELGI